MTVEKNEEVNKSENRGKNTYEGSSYIHGVLPP